MKRKSNRYWVYSKHIHRAGKPGYVSVEFAYPYAQHTGLGISPGMPLARIDGKLPVKQR
jgi:hypothetical protein